MRTRPKWRSSRTGTERLPTAHSETSALELLAGCARYYWAKVGTTDEEFYRDSHECALEASPQQDMEGPYRACLYARGYRRDKYMFPPTPSWRGATE